MLYTDRNYIHMLDINEHEPEWEKFLSPEKNENLILKELQRDSSAQNMPVTARIDFYEKCEQADREVAKKKDYYGLTLTEMVEELHKKAMEADKKIDDAKNAMNSAIPGIKFY